MNEDADKLRIPERLVVEHAFEDANRPPRGAPERCQDFLGPREKLWRHLAIRRRGILRHLFGTACSAKAAATSPASTGRPGRLRTKRAVRTRLRHGIDDAGFVLASAYRARVSVIVRSNMCSGRASFSFRRSVCRSPKSLAEPESAALPFGAGSGATARKGSSCVTRHASQAERRFRPAWWRKCWR